MRSIAVTFLLIGLLVAGMGYSTWAVYHDEETSTGNYVQAGTLDLILSDYSPSANEQWVILNAKPGSPSDDFTGYHHIKLYNNGSIEADHVEIAFKLVCYEDNDGNITNGVVPGPESDTNKTGIGNWLKEIEVFNMKYRYFEGNTLKTKTLVDSNGQPVSPFPLGTVRGGSLDYDGDGIVTLYDLSQIVLDDLPAPPAEPYDPNNHYTEFSMELKILNKDYPQDYWQGDVCELRVQVALLQGSGWDLLNNGGVEGP